MNSYLRIALVAIAAQMTETAFSQNVTLKWDAVPDAAYYAGTVAADGRSVRFRTQETWILADQGAQVTVQAFDHLDRRLGTASVATTSAPQTLAVETGPQEPQEEPESKDEVAAEDAASTPPASPPDAEAELAPDPSRGPMTYRASLALGLGKEWLSADGGVTGYEGETGIVGTIVNAELALDPGISFKAAVAVHNYATSVEEKSAAEDSTAYERDEKFRRIFARCLFDYRINLDASELRQSVFVGAGLAYTQLPFLDVVRETGEAAMVTKIAAGPAFGLGYETYLDLEELGAGLVYAPVFAGGQAKGSTTELGAHWRHPMGETFFTELMLVGRKDGYTMSIDCLSAPNCDDESVTHSDIVQTRLGIGANF